jgi:glyoxylase-like metal-dependent hydrolase (beta-lactamase superfamily II)
VNVYLVIAGGRGILVDPGKRKHLTEVYDAIRKQGLGLSDIKLIILTHTHYDHVDGLKEISEQTGASILVHKNEAPSLVRGYTDIPAGTILTGRILSFLGRNVVPSIGAYPPVTPDILLEDRYDITGWGVHAYMMHTPGHTCGSASLILDNEYAFIGDSMFGIRRRSIFPPFADNPAALMRTWEKLAATGCRMFYPGHGAPITRQRLIINLEKEAS